MDGRGRQRQHFKRKKSPPHFQERAREGISASIAGKYNIDVEILVAGAGPLEKQDHIRIVVHLIGTFQNIVPGPGRETTHLFPFRAEGFKIGLRVHREGGALLKERFGLIKGEARIVVILHEHILDGVERNSIACGHRAFGSNRFETIQVKHELPRTHRCQANKLRLPNAETRRLLAFHTGCEKDLTTFAGGSIAATHREKYVFCE